ncbi:hypothetical protein J4727_12690 [Providencia rettgeri]|uniref:Uncharacterized protein n=1 Tax=Providencia rettgeri TaxID=587 RepID=A0A939NFR1_PRORE|nr:hypothetical protein [Providencia rettgeri]
MAIFASNENEAMISNALASIQSSSIEVLTAWIDKLNNAVSTAEQQVVATAQRKTVLEGLGKLVIKFKILMLKHGWMMAKWSSHTLQRRGMD